MSRKYKFHDNDKLYFISFATVHWIDVFIREEYNHIILDSWKHCQEKRGLEIYGWCIMTSHVHMIIGSKKELSLIHISEPTRRTPISYAVFCLKKKKINK